MSRAFLLLPLFLLLSACAEVQQAGFALIEKRRQMNDMEARAIMAATCDIALGAYFRELSDLERQYAALVCGGQLPRQIPVPTPSAPAAR